MSHLVVEVVLIAHQSADSMSDAFLPRRRTRACGLVAAENSIWSGLDRLREPYRIDALK